MSRSGSKLVGAVVLGLAGMLAAAMPAWSQTGPSRALVAQSGDAKSSTSSGSSRAAGSRAGGAGKSAAAPGRDADRRLGAGAAAADNDENQAVITQGELQQLTTGFADRYMTYLVSAVERIERNNPSPEQRRLAHRVKLVQVSALYDIATNPDPFTQLLDMTLVVSLQARKWIDDDLAERWFGPRGRHLVTASRQAREEIWKIAGRVMRSSQLEQLDTMILEWHRKNRDIELVSYVRFDDFAASRSKSIVAEVAEGGGFLAPIGEATKAVDEVRAVAERALYLLKRMPFLLNWQVRDTLSDSLSGPELGNVGAMLPVVTASIDRATKTVERLPVDIRREREAIDAMLLKHGPLAHQMLTHSRELVRDSNDLTANANVLVGSVESMLVRLDQTSVALRDTVQAVDSAFLKPGREKNDPNDKPFDIADYTKTAVAFSETLGRAQTLVGDLKSSLQSPEQLQALTSGVEASLSRVTDHTSRLVDRVFWWIAALMVLAFVLAVLYRMITRSSAGSARHGDAH
ncbi:MAG: hypothetical protein ABWZ78_17635 [Burkholderiaceae bacterium]